MISGDLSLGQRIHLSSRRKLGILLIAFLSAASLAFILGSFTISDPSRLDASQVSSRTILAPDRVTYTSEIQTQEAQSKAEAQVKDIYDPVDPEIARSQVRQATAVLDYVDTLRHDSYSDIETKTKWLLSVPNLNVPAQTISRTLSLDEPSFHRIVTETIYAVDVTMRDEIHPNDVNAAAARLPTRVSLALAAGQADLAAQWARPFIAPNSFFNSTKTAEQRALARDRVGAVYRTVEKGEAIVREGEIITPLEIETLEALGLLTPRRDLSDYLSASLFAAAIVLFLAAYLARLRPALVTHSRAIIMLAFLLLLSAFAAKTFLPERSYLAYLIPFSAVPMLIAVLIEPQVALGAAIAQGLIIVFLSRGSPELGAYVLFGGLVASLSIGRIERLSAFSWSGLYVALANTVIVLIFRLGVHETAVTTLAEFVLAGLANGGLSSLIALGSLFFVGRVFGITTSLDLLELTRPTHPLLRKLLAEAPGTYHHSLIVSQLAEQAAQQIGADALLSRVAAYYHDVGKTREPQLFVENQIDGINVHDSLDPQASATRVMDHVQRGITLAEQYGVPRRIRDFIPQHHGTTYAAYFLHKAKESGAVVNEQDFHYLGPKPQSREAGILMLADGVEATARAERPTSPEQIRTIINRIVDQRLSDGQLDESNLTLRDIQQIKEAFFGVLQTMYHGQRVKYPSFSEEEQDLMRARRRIMHRN
jgi:cyclic-di-AMP phosphodiesterase PgpH